MQIRKLLCIGSKLRLPQRSYATVTTTGDGNNLHQNRTRTVVSCDEPTSKSKLKMCGWQIHGYGDVDELQFSDKLKMPCIRNSTDCLVRVRTTSVNPIDVAMLGGYGAQLINMMRWDGDGIEFPLTLGREFCGELVQCGMGTSSKVSIGDRVWGVVPVHAVGAHADYVVVPDYCISRAPEILSDEEAASVLYAGLTAWSGLYITGQMGGLCSAVTGEGGGAGQRVLVLGGSGSVGSMAIQILKSQKVQVLATCSEDAVNLVRGVGADCVIDYTKKEEMDKLSQYGPYDVVLDCAGQGADYAECLNFEYSQYITFSSPLLRNIDKSGIALGLIKNIADLIDTNAKSLTQRHALVKWGFFTPAPQGIKFLLRLVERKQLLPIIDSVFEFNKVPEAFTKVKCGHLRGKVVIDIKKAQN